MQRKTAVTAYFTSKRLLLVTFARWYTCIIHVLWLDITNKPGDLHIRHDKLTQCSLNGGRCIEPTLGRCMLFLGCCSNVGLISQSIYYTYYIDQLAMCRSLSCNQSRIGFDNCVKKSADPRYR